MRFAETESQYASKDREVVVKEPVIHTITLPEENIPEGITVLECPETMTEGRTFTIRLQLPENTLIKISDTAIKRENGQLRLPFQVYSICRRTDTLWLCCRETP